MSFFRAPNIGVIFLGDFMFYNFLSLFLVIDDNASSSFMWVSYVSLFVLVAILLALSFLKKNLTTKTLAFAGLTIATSFALSFLKVSPVTYGGSITLASMLPISIFAYAFGLVPSLLVGLIYGFLQFIQNPYIFSYATFFLDFLLAFSSIAMMPIIKKLFKDKKYTPIIAISFVFLIRFIFHFMSGLIYFENGGIWANLPKDNAFIYSFLYQITYLLPDLLVNLVVLFPLIKTNKFSLLLNYMNK